MASLSDMLSVYFLTIVAGVISFCLVVSGLKARDKIYEEYDKSDKNGKVRKILDKINEIR